MRELSIAANAAVFIIETLVAVKELGRRGCTFFKYYTFDSNLLAGAASFLFVLNRLSFPLIGRIAAPAVDMLRFITASMLMLTFLVVVTMLAPHRKPDGFRELLFSGTDKYVHLICPWLSFFSLIFFERPVLRFRTVLFSLIPTVVYALILILLNASGKTVGPYFFLRVRQQSFKISFFYSVVILAAAFLVSLLTWICL